MARIRISLIRNTLIRLIQFEVKAGDRKFGRIVFAFGGHPWLTPVSEENVGEDVPKYKESALIKQ
ncbi:MAG TPA: hypothetical protein VHO70_03430 [Chitinispirillaceae bacterium]|nr:hypothetical protein [Chitinispirillaceae bacterium]